MRVPPSHRRLIALLGTVLFFEGYGRSLLTVTLPYVGRDLGAAPETLSFALAAIATGSLATLALGPLADRIGRRRLLLASLALYSLFGAATATATTLAILVAWQTAARAFQEGALFSAAVVATEEMPPDERAGAQGLLGTLNACGSGFVAVLLALLPTTPATWRWLCLVALLPVVLMPGLRRSVPETRRWLARATAGRSAGWTVRRSHLAAALTVMVLGTAYDVAGFAFATYVPIEEHGWSAAAIGSMVVVAGGIGLPGWWLGGRLSDRWGRRPVAVAFLLGLVSAEALFFLGGSWGFGPGFAAMVFCQGAKTTVLRVWLTELFPTAVRGTTTGWLHAAATVGGMAGLAAAGAVAPHVGGISNALMLLALTSGLGAATVARTVLPETKDTELE